MSKWVKGQSGNPSGRAPIPEDLKDCTPTEIREIIWRLWKYQRHRLKDVLEDPKTPAGVLFIANVYAKGIAQGDPVRLGMLLDRLVGKVKDVVEVQADTRPLTLEEAVKVITEDFAVKALPTEVTIDEL